MNKKLNGKNKERWALRKTTIGMISVLLGLIFVANKTENVVYADSINSKNNVESEMTESPKQVTIKSNNSENSKSESHEVLSNNENRVLNTKNNKVSISTIDNTKNHQQNDVDVELLDKSSEKIQENMVSSKKVVDTSINEKNKLAAYNEHTLENFEYRIKTQEDLDKYYELSSNDRAAKRTLYFENGTPLKFSGSEIDITKDSAWYFTEKSTGNIDFNNTTIAIDNKDSLGWYITNDHNHQVFKNLNVVGSVNNYVTQDGSLKQSEGAGYFAGEMLNASNITFENMKFSNAQVVGGHVFDVMGCSDIVFDNDEFSGYLNADSQKAIDNMYETSPHSVYSEAIQIDFAFQDSGNGNDFSGMNWKPIFYDKLVNDKPTTDVTIRNSKFLPYDGKTGDALISNDMSKVVGKYHYASSVGTHSFPNSVNASNNIKNITIENNLFKSTVSVSTPGDAEGEGSYLLLYPIHFLSNKTNVSNENSIVAKNNIFEDENITLYVNTDNEYNFNGVNPADPSAIGFKSWYANTTPVKYQIKYINDSANGAIIGIEDALPDFNSKKYQSKYNTNFARNGFKFISDDGNTQTYEVHLREDHRSEKDKLAAYDNHPVLELEYRIKTQDDLNKYLKLDSNSKATKKTIYFENTTPLKFSKSQINITKNTTWYFTEKSIGNIDFNNTTLAIDNNAMFVWYMRGDHNNQSIENLNVYGSVNDSIDSKGNISPSNGYFTDHIVDVKNLKFHNLNFYACQTAAGGSHVFEVTGSQNIVFDGVNIYGYGGNFTQEDWDKIATKKLHAVISEAILIDAAIPTTVNKSGNIYFDKLSSRIYDDSIIKNGNTSSGITIKNSIFDSYKGKSGHALINNTMDSVNLTRSPEIGSSGLDTVNSQMPSHIYIYNNAFRHSVGISNPSNSGEKWRYAVMSPIHLETYNTDEMTLNTLQAHDNTFSNENTAIYVDNSNNYNYNGMNPRHPLIQDYKFWYANEKAQKYVVNYVDGSNRIIRVENQLPDFNNEFFNYNSKYARNNFKLIEDINGTQVYDIRLAALDNIKKNSWQKDEAGQWVYMMADGKMARNEKITDNHGDEYYVDNNGHYQINKWAKDAQGNWYYQDKDGKLYKNSWQVVNDKWYYFKPDSVMAANGIATDNHGDRYYFDGAGHYQKNSWQKDEAGQWVYMMADGKMARNEKIIDNHGDEYYVDNNGHY